MDSGCRALHSTALESQSDQAVLFVRPTAENEVLYCQICCTHHVQHEVRFMRICSFVYPICVRLPAALSIRTCSSFCLVFCVDLFFGDWRDLLGEDLADTLFQLCRSVAFTVQT